MKLKETVKTMPQYQQIVDQIKPNTKQLVTGINGSARSLLLSQILSDTKKPMVYITDTMAHADEAYQELSEAAPKDSVFEFPVEELVAAEIATSSPHYRAERVRALNALVSGKPVIIVVSGAGLKRQLPAPNDFKKGKLELKVGKDYELEGLVRTLFSMGYEKTNLVASPGQFAKRGSILDVYPLNSEYPIRIDFFDTEIDSMRTFDAGSQRSIDNVEGQEILPATDFLLSDADRKHGVDALTKAIKKNPDDDLQSKITEMVQGLKAGKTEPNWAEFSQFLYAKKTSILDYLPNDGMVVFDDYGRVRDAQKQLNADEENWAKTVVENHEIFPKQKMSLDFKEITRTDEHATVLFSLFQKGLGNMKLSDITDIKVHPMQRFFGQMPMFKTEINRYQNEGRTVVIAVNSRQRMEKIAGTLTDFGIDVSETTPGNLIKGKVQIVLSDVKNGFDLPAADLAVISESDMFKRVSEQKKKRVHIQNFSNAERLKSYTDLKPGDYVVHVNHGIGRYDGLKTMEVDGKHQDYLTLTFKNDAQIFVPVNQLNLVQKYVSSENTHPKLNKLGGTAWAKTKNKVSSKVEDIADDLVDLYSQREAEKGFAFPQDDAMQEKFESAFPYQDTPDQIRSTEEIKQDMEKPHPMDRLLVGDVGYGKTEVALRAAFKAISAGKQVAFLVPTTVLAQQHYETMLERFADFPVNVGVLSRFDTAKQTKETIQGLKDGKIDIVVGTHRMLSKDIKFKDLGLLIVDEEQRFGVKHKERIKQLKADVDVLTLTATPIPRTLNMSMMGVRDLSVIETPPANRFPIQTYVMEQNQGSVVDGIRREMQRGGQVFYLHNRVKDIEQTVDKLHTLLPDARIAHIDGQMSENEMEGILYQFVNGEFDVLVTTTIIETGVDIPNVNTLFVEDADKMGLSQLYQIRGRIGRSNRVGQAYFMYQPNKVLTEVSENRLEAIKDFTELGSGFKVAMRDLSIRGAGNVLGKQQHGFINSVGYDMYTKMLSEAVANKKGHKVKQEKTDATVELGIEAYIPSDYIQDNEQKIEMYKRIRQMDNSDTYLELQSDLIDRFGEYPEAVAHLLDVDRIKMMADFDLIDKIRRNGNDLEITMSKLGSQKYDSKEILKAISNTDFRSTMQLVDGRFRIKLVIQPTMKTNDWLTNLYQFVKSLSEVRIEQLKKEEKRK